MAILPATKTTGFLKIVKQTIHLRCHVKPNVSASRAGAIKPFSDTSSSLEVCVAAPARDNEANERVVELLSDILLCPKTDLEVIRGKKSMDKVIAYKSLEGLWINDAIAKVTVKELRQRLQEASRDAEA
ncbi:741eb636-4bfc-40a4-af74-c5ee8eec8a40 [Sclerotinia trifoliorum]|uniref:741eb636-4bfc-40a4-af74-c5ee8eec8a40 n=1 Tax=Sclerotinia trifoliorum TaxID=28548 RepID=A0A8H2ZVW5_9HELO|nr:741eb636-4bfc-40a4-af74-c5ee8eec8a40 [Sclerotinia trifoliorum]